MWSWRTTAWAVLFGGCTVADFFFPGVSVACSILEKLAIVGGLVSAADAANVRKMLERP